MEMKQSICDKDCFHCRFSDCVNHYGPYTEAKDIKKALNGQKKSRGPAATRNAANKNTVSTY